MSDDVFDLATTPRIEGLPGFSCDGRGCDEREEKFHDYISGRMFHRVLIGPIFTTSKSLPFTLRMGSSSS